MHKNLKNSLNHFGWLLYVSGSTSIPFLKDPAPDIERAYKTFTDQMFADILNDPQKARKNWFPLKRELINLLDQATEVICAFKDDDPRRYNAAVSIYNKLCMIIDFLDDFQEQPA